MAKERTFQVAGHLQLAGIQSAAITGTIRTKIKASSQQEAEEKFKAFLLSKAQPVVSVVREADTAWDGLQDAFRNMGVKI